VAVQSASSSTLIGTSPGPSLIAAFGALPKCQVVRVFGGGLPGTVASNAEFQLAVNRGCEVWYSFSTMPSQQQFQAALADWMKAPVPIWWTFSHEADQPKETPSVYQADYTQLMAWVRSMAGYAGSNVHAQTILEAYHLEQNPAPDEGYYVPAVERLGFDSYTDIGMSKAQAYAKAKGKPWVIPEMGAGGAGGQGGAGDDAALAWVKARVASWSSYPPEGACWYNSTQGTNARSAPLTSLPKTAAYLNSIA
jgi:hypothetical protein